MTKRERVEQALAGREPDRVPISFWYHFPSDKVEGQLMADAHYEYFKDLDLDFIKVMNDTPYVDPKVKSCKSASDFCKLGKVDLAATSMAGEIEGIKILREKVGPDVHLIVTIFGPYATADKLADKTLVDRVAEDSEAVRKGLSAITDNLAGFAQAAVSAGADGIYLSAQGSGEELPKGTYRDLFRPFDLQLVEAVKDAPFNLLHVCGTTNDFDNFLDYNVSAINWADRSAGPSLAEAKKLTDKCICGGVDHIDLVKDGTLDDLKNQVRDAIAQAGRAGFIVAAGCTVPSDTSHDRLRAMREVVEE